MLERVHVLILGIVAAGLSGCSGRSLPTDHGRGNTGGSGQDGGVGTDDAALGAGGMGGQGATGGSGGGQCADPDSSSTPDPLACPDKNFEPNDIKDEATPIGIGETKDLAICPAADVDYFRMELERHQRIKVFLKYTPRRDGGALGLIAFGGGTTETSGTTTSAVVRDDCGHQTGLALILAAETPLANDVFFLKIYPLSGDAKAKGGANFYSLDITPSK